jgi:uncharacterized membrane protein
MMSDNRNAPKSSRLIPLDLLRGILIVLMALDHANYHVAQQHSTGEYWGGLLPQYSTTGHFITRFVTHFCAPGFFFLLGIGMVLFSKSRLERGWDNSRIRSHFLVRGLLLMVFQVLIVFLGAWSVGPTPAPLLYVGVLAALGAGMVLCIPLLFVKPIIQLSLAGLLFLILELLTPDPSMWGRAFENFLGVLLVYGGGTGDFWVNYPLLAWVEVILFGMAFGGWLIKDPKNAQRLSLKIGPGFLIAFLILRLVNGFGNIRSYELYSWIDFFNLVKYPPSMTFTLLTLGINLIMVGLFMRYLSNRMNINNPLIVFGRVPLFAYVGHIAIYLFFGRLFTPGGTSLGIMYLFWIAGLFLLYWPARWYGDFKTSHPGESWVRYL